MLAFYEQRTDNAEFPITCQASLIAVKLHKSQNVSEIPIFFPDNFYVVIRDTELFGYIADRVLQAVIFNFDPIVDVLSNSGVPHVVGTSLP